MRIFCLILFLLLSQVCQADTGESFKLLGSFGGAPGPVKLRGKYLYLGEGLSLTILDCSNPDHPDLSVRLPLDSRVKYIELCGTKAFCLTETGLNIVDISQPSAPKTMGHLSVSYGTGVTAISDQWVFVSCDRGILVIDVTNPGSPMVTSTLTDHCYMNVKAVGNLLVADSYVTLPNGIYGHLIDFSNPTAPVSRNDIDAVGLEMAASGSLLYAINSAGDFVIYDLSDPTSATTKSILHASKKCQKVALSGSTALIERDDDIVITDVSNAASPKITGTIPNYYVRGSYITIDNLLACISSESHYQLIDLTQPAAPKNRGGYDIQLNNPYGGMAFAGNRVYACDWHSLSILDISNPSHITLTGPFNIPAMDCDDIILTGSLGLVHSRYPTKLFVYDLSKPTSPTLIGNLTLMNAFTAATKFAISGSLAYIAEGQQLFVIDFKNPRMPAIRNVIQMPLNGENVLISGSKAFVSGPVAPEFIDTPRQIAIFDLSNPVSPQYVSSYGTTIKRVTGVSGSYVHALTIYGDFEIISIIDPWSPKLLSSIHFDINWLLGIDVSNATSFVAGNSFQVIDSVFPDRPRVQASMPIDYGIYSITGSGSKFILDRFDDGIILYQYTGKLYSHASKAWMDLQ